MQGLRRGLVCMLLAALVCLAACGFSGGPANPAEDDPTTLPVLPTAPAPAQPKDILVLPFAQRDVLNPYALTTELNLELAPLLYEGLFATDETFQAQPVLADKITRQNPTQWGVTLNHDRVFHNRKAVTAEDVLYSYNKAKASPHYATRLENVSKLQIQDNGSLLFTLKKANLYIAACLDFPIVPAGSAEQGNVQGKNGYAFTKASTPPGTGRYTLESRDGAFYLAWFDQHPAPKPTFTTLQFYGLNSTGSLLYGLEMGNYQFAFDALRSGTVARVSATSVRVPTTQLIYLSFHQSRGALRDAALRRALAACIDKTAMLGSAFQGYAEATDTPFPPKWHGVKAEDFAKPYDEANARKLLETLGYTDLRGGVRASKYRKLEFTLLVGSADKRKTAAAKAIQTQLGKFQIGVTVQALPKADYEAAVKAGRFDLCLGEMKLTPDCNLSPLLLQGGVASKGINVWGKAASAYGLLLQGLQKPAEFVSAFQEELPFVPLGYRDGMAVAVRSLHIPNTLQRGNLFSNIDQWYF